MLDDLARAKGALERGALDEALAALLEAWRSKRDPGLADLIDRVSAELAKEQPTLIATPLAKQWKAWRAVAKRKAPADLERLMAVPLPRRYTDAEPHLQPLLRWPDDPRLARFLTRLVADTVFDPRWGDPRSDGVYDFYHSIMEKLVKLGDTRALPALEDAAHRRLRKGSWRFVRSLYAEQLRELPAPVLDGGERALIEEMASRYRADAAAEATIDRLLADVYERPDDLAARAVWADALTERGDPRGELVALQLARRAGEPTEAADRRERGLLTAHYRKWMGAAGGWFPEESLVFEDGLLAGGSLAMPLPDDEALRDPAWRAIRMLEVREGLVVRLLSHGNLAGVRRLRIPERFVHELARREWPFEELVVTSWLGDGLAPGAQRIETHPLAATAAFPRLKVLGFCDCDTEHLAWLDGAPILGRIEHLILGSYVSLMKALWPILTASALPRISFRGSSWSLTPRGWDHELSRDHRGRFGRLRCEIVDPWRMPSGGDYDSDAMSQEHLEMFLVNTLQALPEDELTEVAIERSAAALKLSRPKIEKALARFRSLASVRLPWD